MASTQLPQDSSSAVASSVVQTADNEVGTPASPVPVLETSPPQPKPGSSAVSGKQAEMQQVEQLRQQIKMLERAVGAETAEQAITTWALAVKSRNGALQYAVLSPDSRARQLKYFEACNWITGTSSPWLERYRIDEGKKQPDGSYVFQMKLDYRTSTDAEKKLAWSDIEDYALAVRQYGEFWYVEE